MPPEHWDTKPLGNIVSLDYGAGLPDTRRSGDGFPVYGSSGEVGRHCNYLVPGPGIVVGRKGTVGAVIWSPDPFWPIDTTYYVVPKGRLNLRWCYWLLSTLPLQRLDSSTGVPGLNRNDAYRLHIKIPPLAEQQRIAEILDTVDAAIQQTEALITKLKQMKAGLLHDLLTRGLDEHGQLRDPVAHPEQFNGSPVGRIPTQWKVAQLSAIAEVNRGKFSARPRNDPRFYNGPFPFIQTSDITHADNGFLDSFSQTLNNLGLAVSRQFPAGTIAITIAANIADTAILARPMCFPDSVVGAEVRAPHNVRFMELSIRRAKHDLEARAPQSAQKNINLQDLRPLMIALPSPAEQDAIAHVYDAYDARIRAEEAYRDKLKLLKKGLMDDLLTGRVRVAAPLEAVS